MTLSIRAKQLGSAALLVALIILVGVLGDEAAVVADGVEADVGAQHGPVAAHDAQPQAQRVGDLERRAQRAVDLRAIGRMDQLERLPSDQLLGAVAEHLLGRCGRREPAAVESMAQVDVRRERGQEGRLLVERLDRHRFCFDA